MGSTTLELSFCYDTQSQESLLELWKLTRNTAISAHFTSTQRLNNRSWRLLSTEAVLRRKGKVIVVNDLSNSSLSSMEPNSSQFLCNRPSLFLNISKSTLFSHSCKAAAAAADHHSMACDRDDCDVIKLDSETDISDISEEEDCLSSDSEVILKTEKQSVPPFPEKNDDYFLVGLRPDTGGAPNQSLSRSGTSFVRGFTPSKSFGSCCDSENHTSANCTTQEQINNNPFVANSSSKSKNKNIFFLANSPSPPHIDNEKNANSKDGQRSLEGAKSPGDPEALSRPSTQSVESADAHQHGKIQRQDSLFSNMHANVNIDRQESDDAYSSTDISEDEAEEEEEEEEDSDLDNFDEDKEISHSSVKMSSVASSRPISKNRNEDDDSEWLSVSSDDAKSHILAIAKPELDFNKRSDITPTSTLGVSFDSSSNGPPPPPLTKPRSLLSGLFLNEMANVSENKSQNKPVLQRSSTTGIITVDQSRNQKHPSMGSGGAKRPSILFSKKYASSADISKNYPHYHNDVVQKNIFNNYEEYQNEQDTDLLGKQKSIVGISEFNVTTKSLNSKGPNASSSTSFSQHNDQGSLNTDSLTLSSSLNKYSGSLSNHSIKNLLSKSSLSLSHIFNPKHKLKGGEITSMSDRLESLKPQDSNSTTISADKTVDRVSSNSRSTSSSSPQAPSAHPPAPSPPTTTNIHEILDKAMSSKVPPLESSRVNRISEPKPARLSPKSTRRSMLSTELSKSLKDSIITDYKLGKVPLPAKVVKNYIPSEDEKKLGDTNVDDYHSKGW